MKKAMKKAPPDFSQKHYLKLARAIARAVRSVTEQVPFEDRDKALVGLAAVVSSMNDEFAHDNPRFSKKKFLISINKGEESDFPVEEEATAPYPPDPFDPDTWSAPTVVRTIPVTRIAEDELVYVTTFDSGTKP